ncbi:prolipoprotein diacylglyceryl transferase [Clostridium rectalis]|uniref:prolipoprotein diacylglyceryl transferase n=1 Tax=Clostridium rectalis TaxID=2040295 RepID=UPI000F6327CA|nr:prolipoprotein diacylglyceryl transferase [Clostridium rectalis]
MNPVAFNFLGIEIKWYGIFIATGVLIALMLAKYNCKIKKVNFDILSDIFIVSFPIAIIGARLYYVAFEFEFYKGDIISIFNIRQGGLAIHGGIIFGVLAAYIYIKKRKDSFLKYADISAPSIILAQSIGRWGNFFNKEAYGDIVGYEYISKFPHFIQEGMFMNGNYYNPTFLYESVWNLIVCIILLIILRKTKKRGITFFTYIGLYSLGRFFIEGLRTDSLMFGFIRVAQFISIIGILIWVIFLLIIKIREK